MNATISFHSAASPLLSAAHYSQASRLLVLHTPLGADRLLAEQLQGWERIDEGGFALELSALSDDAHIPLKSLLGQAVRLDLQTAGGAPRHWHGHVTAFELQASNGGFARYRLRIEPWLAFLRWQQDSFIHQEKSVVEIVDAVLARWQGAGSLQPAWRWELADAAIYPQRGTTTQYHESELAFLTRLLAEEGVYYWFEHQGAEESRDEGGDGNSSLGSHTLVLADHAGAHQAGTQARIAFHRADATEAQDTLQHWQEQRRLQTSALARNSWDYRSVDVRPLQRSGANPAASALAALGWSDEPGLYGWQNAEQGERLLGNAIEALAARQHLWHGQGSVRTLAPATTFVLEDHHAHEGQSEDERRFLVLQVRHSARNNFDEDLKRAIDQAIGAPGQAPGPASETRSDSGNNGNRGNSAADVPYYRNRFIAIHAATAYRPLSRDGHGLLIHPRPTVHGSQSAIVVGSGQPVHSDRDQRIKIQFHWQRGSAASARSQPHPSGEDNAPARAELGAWVRVASAAAGDNWGHMGIPRVGQEVLVDFIAGDIDRPVVVGSLYNGEGEADSQANRQQVGAAGATGNAPAWFAGESGEHAHNAVYSGIKSQELQSSQSGEGGYNQLVFDGTPGQERLGLASTQAASRLHLGAHRQQSDNQRGAGRGHGAELASRAQGAVRGGSGLLISAHSQSEGQGELLAGQSEQEQVRQAHQLAQSLAQSAQAQNAVLKDEAQADKLPAIAALEHIGQVLAARAESQASQAQDSNGDNSGSGAIRATEGGQGSVTAYSEAHLQLSAPKGIALATPEQAVLVSGTTSSAIGGQDLEIIAQGQLAIAASQGLSLYTIGGQAAAGEPNQERGIKLHAASGAVKVQSQQGQTRMAAQQSVTFASTTQDVQVLGSENVLLSAGGAYIRLGGGNIQIHAPGAVTFKAGAHNFSGPGGAGAGAPKFGGSELRGCEQRDRLAASGGAATVDL